MGWKTDPVYGFSVKVIPSSIHKILFLDVNTEIEILKSTVVKVINNKAMHSPKPETHILCVDDQGWTTCHFWL
jgi:hypothetical protein